MVRRMVEVARKRMALRYALMAVGEVKNRSGVRARVCPSTYQQSGVPTQQDTASSWWSSYPCLLQQGLARLLLLLIVVRHIVHVLVQAFSRWLICWYTIREAHDERVRQVSRGHGSNQEAGRTRHVKMHVLS